MPIRPPKEINRSRETDGQPEMVSRRAFGKKLVAGAAGAGTLLVVEGIPIALHEHNKKEEERKADLARVVGFLRKGEGNLRFFPGHIDKAGKNEGKEVTASEFFKDMCEMFEIDEASRTLIKYNNAKYKASEGVDNGFGKYLAESFSYAVESEQLYGEGINVDRKAEEVGFSSSFGMAQIEAGAARDMVLKYGKKLVAKGYLPEHVYARIMALPPKSDELSSVMDLYGDTSVLLGMMYFFEGLKLYGGQSGYNTEGKALPYDHSKDVVEGGRKLEFSVRAKDNSRGVSLAYAMYSASKFTPILTKIQVLCEELAMTDEKFKGIMKNALEKETADITPDGSFGPQSKKLILAYLKYRNHPLKNTFASAWDSIEQKPDEGARQFAERRDTEHMALLSRVADSVSKSWDMQKDTLKLRLGNLNDKKTLKQFFENRYSACWRMCDQLLKALCPSRVVGEDGKVRYGSDSERVMGERLHSLADAYLTKRTGSFLDIITDERELQEMFPEAKINFELRLKTAISQALEYDALRRGFLPMHHYSGKMLGFGVDKDIAAKIVKMQSLIH